MLEKPIRIGVFASADSMIDHIKSLARMDDDIEVSIDTQGLEESVPVAQGMEKEGVEIILSRRGTAHLLRENLHIPVLAFPQSDLNLILRLKEASELGKKILLPMFRSKLDHLDDLFNLLGINVSQRVYEDLASLESIIVNAKTQNYDVVVGGSHSIGFAKENNIKAIEIQSSVQTIATTIEDAKSVVISNRIELEKKQRFETIINSTSDGIMVVQEDGLIIFLNKSAKLLLKKNDEDLVGKKISEFISRPQILRCIDSKTEITDNIETLFDKTLVFNHTPITVKGKVVGGVSCFNDIGNLIKTESKVRKQLSKGLIAQYYIEDLTYKSPEMAEIVSRVKHYSKTNSTILITGETGTGKEILAQSIHNLSTRSRQPFVSINCAAIPENLLESELFGYEEGAFTGSRKGGKPGLFELAHTGTIFLDELSEASLAVQTRLLRVLQEREVMRIGSDLLVPINVRVIVAVNKDLAQEVKKNNFREDLFFRINVLNIHLPPLRKRTGDISILVEHFIEKISQECSYKPFSVPESFMNLLSVYSWPGNIRQLRNFIERLVLLCKSKFDTKIFYELYEDLQKYKIYGNGYEEEDKEISMITVNKRENIDKGDVKKIINSKRGEVESKIIENVLQQVHYNKNKAAEVLGMSRTTLWRKIRDYNLL